MSWEGRTAGGACPGWSAAETACTQLSDPVLPAGLEEEDLHSLPVVVVVVAVDRIAAVAGHTAAAGAGIDPDPDPEVVEVDPVSLCQFLALLNSIFRDDVQSGSVNIGTRRTYPYG